MALRVCRKYNSVLYSYIGWEIDELFLHSLPPHNLFCTHRPPLYTFPLPTGAVCGWARGWGGKCAELVNQPPYVGVEHRIILAANAQCHICIPFILFSILSSLILWCIQNRNRYRTPHHHFIYHFTLVLNHILSTISTLCQPQHV